MKHILTILAFLSMLHSVQAQVIQAPMNQKEVPGKRIMYSAHLPDAVVNRMRRGAKSSFLGTFKLPEGQKFLLHLFHLKQKSRASYEHGIHEVLHIFQRKTHGLRLIKTVPIDIDSNLVSPNHYGSQLLWLDPQHQTKPILKFDCFNVDPYADTDAIHVLIIFPDGLSGRAVTQSIHYGFWKSSDYLGQRTKFDETDETGLLQLHTFMSVAAEAPPQEVIMRWDGKKFVRTQGLRDPF